MTIDRIEKASFTVIGKEGATTDGADFIQRLWTDANAHFDQVAHLAKRDKDGQLAGVWGVMSDFTRSFQPWEAFNRGLYLAGVECIDDAEAPPGWTKWVVPGYVYLRVEQEGPGTFAEMLRYLEENSIPLAGAVHDFTCPATGKSYMMFPIRRL